MYNDFRIVGSYPCGKQLLTKVQCLCTVFIVFSLTIFTHFQSYLGQYHNPTISFSEVLLCLYTEYFFHKQHSILRSCYLLTVWIEFEYIKVYSMCCTFLRVSTNAFYNVSTTIISYNVVSLP